MKKGILINIESGTDGSGKATQAEKLTTALIEKGYSVRKISFPNYESPACEPVKLYLQGAFGTQADDVNAYTASTFYAIDRFASYRMDWGAFYEAGGIIIADRYVTSNLIHQGTKMSREERKLYSAWLKDLEYQKYGLPIPDLTLFLNVEPTVTRMLREGRQNKMTGGAILDIHESDMSHLSRAYQNAMELVNEEGWHVINCTKDQAMRTVESIHEEILQRALSLFE